MADFRLEAAVAYCGHGWYLLVPGELGAKSVAVVGECGGCEYKGCCCCKQKCLHTCLLPFVGWYVTPGRMRGSRRSCPGPPCSSPKRKPIIGHTYYRRMTISRGSNSLAVKALSGCTCRWLRAALRWREARLVPMKAESTHGAGSMHRLEASNEVHRTLLSLACCTSATQSSGKPAGIGPVHFAPCAAAAGPASR